MQGYWNNAEETAVVMKDGWLHTGDIVHMDGDGYFYMVDRMKDVINVAGYKVWPREVEEVLYMHPAIEMTAVVGVSDSHRGESVKAYVVVKESYEAKVSTLELVSHCKEHLANYKVPRMIEFRATLPVNGAGKVLRRMLRN